MTVIRAILGLFVIGMLCAPATAKTEMAVEIGWDRSIRISRWCPLYITARDSTPRNVLVRVYANHDSVNSMVVNQRVAISPTPSTFVIYIPLTQVQDELSVSLLDPGSHRRLANVSFDQFNRMAQPSEIATQLIGISGRPGANRLLEGQIRSDQLVAKWCEPLRLPATDRGYDALNALVLDRPDLARMTIEQQDAIINWVRGGGQLICWMGEDALPGSCPILDSLPAIVGENRVIELSDAALRSAGLAARFRTLKGRTLNPIPGATRIGLMNDEVEAWKHDVGFGAVVLLPFDPSTVLFPDPRAKEFWRPLLAGVVQPPPQPVRQNVGNRVQTYTNPIQDFTPMRRGMASNRVMDLLGDVPGVGSFGFTYVALVMIGMMLIVGPIDWIVLKRLGRQPWTWTTTGGWIALITLGAVYIGNVFKSGDLHFRTLRLTDQAGGMVVANIDAIGIYSPRTQQYDLQVSNDGWWEPLSADINYYSSGNLRSDTDFHQDYQGTRPEQMHINVWNLRFLQSQTLGAAPAAIEAKLRYEKRDGRNFMVGTMTNRGNLPLKDVRVRVRNGLCRLTQTIQPGETINIDTAFTENDRAFNFDTRQNQHVYYPYGVSPNRPGDDPIAAIWDLPVDRAVRVENALTDRANAACIYAAYDSPTPVANLRQPPNHQQHTHLLRALITLEAANP